MVELTIRKKMKLIAIILMLAVAQTLFGSPQSSPSFNAPKLAKKGDTLTIEEFAGVIEKNLKKREATKSQPINHERVLDEKRRQDIRALVQEMDSIAAKDIPKHEKDKLLNTIMLRMLRDFRGYRGLTLICMLELVPDLKTDLARKKCLSYTAMSMGDLRVIEPLKKLLTSDQYTPTQSQRLYIYRGIARWGGADATDFFRREYSEISPYVVRFEIATELALYGDKTGVLTLIESLDKNIDDMVLRVIPRTYLVRLYSVDLGYDVAAWKRLVYEGKRVIAPR